MNKLTISLAIALTVAIFTISCDKSNNNYNGVSTSLTKYGAIKEKSWYKFYDSLGTGKDCVVVEKVSNIFNPLAGESDENLYQTITIKFRHYPSKDSSIIEMVRDKSSSTFKYINTKKEETIVLTDPITNGVSTTITDSLKSGKRWFTDVLVVSEAGDPARVIYLANGKWLIKKTYSTTPAQNWIIDTLVIK
jgi:hypothetical protein